MDDELANVSRRSAKNVDIYDEVDDYIDDATDVVDLVTAYKSLKHAMTKNLKGYAGGRE
jgi:phosphoglucomutase